MERWMALMRVLVAIAVGWSATGAAAVAAVIADEESRPPRRSRGRLRPPPRITCDPSIGTVIPAQVCSASQPCVDLLATYASLDPPVHEITTASDKPVCATSRRGLDRGRPAFDDGEPVSWIDGQGVTRYRCQLLPSEVIPAAGWPLVIWIPGSGGHAGSVYDTTSLRGKAVSFDLSGDPDRIGFLLVSIQPRNLHWPTASPQDGTKHDSYYRDLTSPSTNPDIAHIDAVIDDLAGQGIADPSQIYLMGWSNGGRFAALYGIARHRTPTPGGHRVAAVALYSSGDPFENIAYGFFPSCVQDPYPVSEVPIYLISRTCDAVACNEAQDERFRRDGFRTTPGNVAGTWVQTLESAVGNPNVQWRRINASGRAAAWCTAAWLCSMTTAALNHLFWPDGVEDRGGVDWEPEMLEFLGDHPLRDDRD
jgi:dienelactone hydrolase